MCGIPLAAAFTVPAGNLCAGSAAAPMINALQSSSRVGGAVSREGGALSLRAEGGNGERPEPKDGSIEKLLGGLGPMGAKMGAGIDWFFDTSDIQGAKAWRLQSIQGEADSVKWRGGTGDDLEDMLQEQISSREWSSDEMQAEDELTAEYSMSDADLSSAFGARLSTLQMEAQAQDGNILTGAELALMCYKKYGLYHDMALKADKMQLVSDKRLVSVNIYYAYFGQLNPQFQYSEEQYLAKLDAIARAVNQWGQAEFVREFFRERPTAYRGLPSRPRWDTAVSIRLNRSPTWNDALADDYFLT